MAQPAHYVCFRPGQPLLRKEQRCPSGATWRAMLALAALALSSAAAGCHVSTNPGIDAGATQSSDDPSTMPGSMLEPGPNVKAGSPAGGPRPSPRQDAGRQ
jgi:hypothetical protein